MDIGYFGPSGTFTEAAARKYAPKARYIPFGTIDECLYAVDDGRIKEAVVPIDNSTEGIVNVSMDTLIFDTNIYIKTGLTLPIVQNLMILKKNTGKEITKILSHPQPLMQCRKYLNTHYNGAEQEIAASTAEAARIVAEADGAYAAIGPSICAELYGLEIIGHGINDQKNNVTNFIVVTKENDHKNISGYRTTIAFSTENKPGTLIKVLNIFSLWDINMTALFSRPMKTKVGEHVFYVDLEGYNDPADVEEALAMVKRKTSFFKFLGSYPVLGSV